MTLYIQIEQGGENLQERFEQIAAILQAQGYEISNLCLVAEVTLPKTLSDSDS